jgi:glycosyltransferase involved in cell wall biosynthesis
MYLKDLIPGAKIIGLFEWWFLPQTSKWLFSDFTFDTQLKTQTRNLVTQHELQACDAAVVPTAWQAQQFPAAWENHIKIIFDGINSSFFFPPVNSLSRETEFQGEEGDKIKISSDQLLLSYATRGMEPLRGFPQFMHALPELLDYYPNLHVVIAGRDRCVYSYPSPAANGSWKEYCLELEQISGHRRVHFTGLLPYAQYRKLLWRSDCHCSFSRPYVLSWSLFEALGCGTPLVVNDTEAHRSVVHESAAQWVDLDNSDVISEAIRKVLDQDVCERFSYLPNSFSLESCLTSWVSLIKEIVG